MRLGYTEGFHAYGRLGRNITRRIYRKSPLARAEQRPAAPEQQRASPDHESPHPIAHSIEGEIAAHALVSPDDSPSIESAPLYSTGGAHRRRVRATQYVSPS